MNLIGRILSLAVMSAEILTHHAPAGVLLVGGIIAAGLLAINLDKGRAVRAWLWGLSPLVISFSILMCGAVFWDAEDNGLNWPISVHNLLLLAHIPLAAVLAFFQRRARCFVLALSVAIFGYSISAWIVSGMAITGDWL